MAQHGGRAEYQLSSRCHEVLADLVVRPCLGRQEDAPADTYDRPVSRRVRITCGVIPEDNSVSREAGWLGKRKGRGVRTHPD
jgi:hypothetical protein